MDSTRYQIVSRTGPKLTFAGRQQPAAGTLHTAQQFWNRHECPAVVGPSVWRALWGTSATAERVRAIGPTVPWPMGQQCLKLWPRIASLLCAVVLCSRRTQAVTFTIQPWLRLRLIVLFRRFPSLLFFSSLESFKATLQFAVVIPQRTPSTQSTALHHSSHKTRTKPPRRTVTRHLPEKNTPHKSKSDHLIEPSCCVVIIKTFLPRKIVSVLIPNQRQTLDEVVSS